MNVQIERIDAFLDTVVRTVSSPESIGQMTLFVSPVGPGYYARPTQGSGPIAPHHIDAVRARQTELGVPVAFEWLAEAHPELEALTRRAGLSVNHCPLLVYSRSVRKPTARKGQRTTPPTTATHLIGPNDQRLASVLAVRDVAFSSPRPRRGPTGCAARDLAAREISPLILKMHNDRLSSGRSILAATIGADGPICAGGAQILDRVAEITGVGTLPVARRVGHASELTSLLATTLCDKGVEVIFLSAANAEVARLYERIGFDHIGEAMTATRRSSSSPT